jgi:serine/threonine-protein kinase
MDHMLKTGDLLISRYKVSAFHAQGSMQEVYVCHDWVLDRKVVVKTPMKGVADRRFKRGAEMGARVNHPNVAATFDYYEDEKLTFLVEEFVEGVDLAKRLESEFQFLDPFLAAHVIHHIARALFEAHRAGISHRDLKPSNIMTSRDPGIESIKLTDFGIAKLAENEIAAEMERYDRDAATLTSSNTLLGAVPYMAPECWQDWKSAGQPMDVWSLGCIGYQLLSGRPPFGTGQKAIRNVIQAETTGKVSLSKPAWFGRHTWAAALEDELWQVIMRCMEIDPSRRPTAKDIVIACDQLCYAGAPRRQGVILEYGIRYASGRASKSGKIVDDISREGLFFHISDFFGEQAPSSGQRVNFSLYPGYPNQRASPVLLLR